ncbi:MAG: protoporphyrin/coproporphyrin ferrochelatase [Aliidongia sp.]|nr:protoporphyrin/coproporphyrin ferrochelatase [Aliidongia sp.]
MKTAIVLFNLGGPDGQSAVRPFLFNLFFDPAIIGLPRPLRWLIARWISSRRAPIAREIYGQIGGGSPLLANTEAQAEALERALGPGFKCFITMRYWHPRADAQARAVAAWQPDRVILVPLYPQFSATTTASSLREWRAAAGRAGLRAPETTLCCYPDEPGFVAAIAGRVRDGMARLPQSSTPPRLLFSAHGLPQKVVDAGDPYQWQVERSVAAVVAALGIPGLDTVLCYQSRVGPLKWLQPSTEAEIERAGADGVPLVVVPIAFVSEHSETLVELDIEYRHVAEQHGVPAYIRVPTVDILPQFINGLAGEIRRTLDRGETLCSARGGRLCPMEARLCAFATRG